MDGFSMSRWWRTAGNLRFSQIARRAWYATERKFGLRLTGRSPQGAGNAFEVRDGFIPPPLPPHETPGIDVFNELRQGQLTLVNRTLPFHSRHASWRLGPQAEDRLPAITLHYHQWLFDLVDLAMRAKEPMRSEAADLAKSLLRNWLEACGTWSDETRHLAWNSYAIATRIGWWVRILCLPGDLGDGWAELRRDLEANLITQTEHLHGHLEWDLRGNHLIRDALGLAWSGAYFDGPRAVRWRKTARRIGRTQLQEQVMPDGFHFERSPMYHVQVMQDVACMATLLDDEEFRECAQDTLKRMRGALEWMVHADGVAPQWNDGSRVAPSQAFPDWRRRAPSNPGGIWLGDAGWAIWRGDAWRVFFDLGQAGPSCQPGHAHADTLAVECSFRGQRLFVDPGTWSYDLSPERERDRSTAAHNTIVCDGRNSSEVWHIFRMGRRAEVRNVHVCLSQSDFDAVGEHDGFEPLQQGLRHRRRVRVHDDASLEIEDVVQTARESSVRRRLEGGWLLEPGWRVEQQQQGWRLSHPLVEDVLVHVAGPESLRLSVQNAVVHPDYYVAEETLRLHWSYEGPMPCRISTTVLPAKMVNSQQKTVEQANIGS